MEQIVLEDDNDKLMKHLDIEFVLEETLQNKLHSDDEPLNLLTPEANYHVIGIWTIEKTLEEGSSKAEKKEKEKAKKKAMEREKTKEKTGEKAKKKK